MILIMVPGIDAKSKYFRVPGVIGVYRVENVTVGRKRMMTFKIYRKLDGVETHEDTLAHTSAYKCLVGYLSLHGIVPKAGEPEYMPTYRGDA